MVLADQGLRRRKVLAAWLDFRTDALRKMLEDRLAKLGLDETAAAPLINNLLESKQRRPREAETSENFPRPSAPLSPGAAPRQTLLTESDLRRLATIAISEMSTDELRRLWLPLGAIVNGFGRNDT